MSNDPTLLADTKKFKRMLGSYLGRTGATIKVLAEMLDISTETLVDLEDDNSPLPSENLLYRIVNVVNLSQHEAIALFSSAGLVFDVMTAYDFFSAARPLDSETGFWVNKPRTLNGESRLFPLADLSNKSLNSQADLVLQTRIDNLTSTVETLQDLIKQPDQMGSDVLQRIQQELSVITINLDKLKTEAPRITAPVRIPTPEAMEVTLVSTTMLERLEEYRHESNKWDTIFGLFIGATLGILTNLVTGGEMTFETWVVIAILVGMSAFTGWTGHKYKERAAVIKDKINPKEVKQQQHGLP